MGYAAKAAEERREANKNERIDLTMYMATTPKENLPAGVANRWAADLVGAGSKEADDLRKFLQDPSRNKFVLFFATKKEAVDYARALDSLLGRTGVLSNVVINVSEKSARDEEKYTLGPGQNYKIELSADERERIPPLKRREEMILAKFRGAESTAETGVAGIVPAPKRQFELSQDPMQGIDLEGSVPKIVRSAEELRGILSRKFVDSDKEVLPIIPKKSTIDEIVGAIRNPDKLYSFNVKGQTRMGEVERALKECGATYRVEALGRRDFRVVINGEDLAAMEL